MKNKYQNFKSRYISNIRGFFLFLSYRPCHACHVCSSSYKESSESRIHPTPNWFFHFNQGFIHWSYFVRVSLHFFMLLWAVFFLFVRLLLRKCLKVICPCENQTWYKKFWFKKCINLIWCWKRVHVLTCLAYLHFLLYLFIHTLITIDSISWLKSTIKLYSSKLINVN